MAEKPDCYKCVHRLDIPGNEHSRCNNHTANVYGDPHGIRMGWFRWPLNYDPTWLQTCDGFSNNPADKQPLKELHPLAEILALLS